MATVTSLTEAKIQELMAGWVAVGLSQDEINALVSQLRMDVDSQEAVLTNFEEVVVPQLQADLAAGSIAVAELNDTTIPSLQQTLDAHDLNLVDLNTVHIPSLNDRVDSNSDSIIDLNTVQLPALDAEVTALEDKFPISGPDIAANAITANHIGADEITASEIAARTITAAEIAVDTITANEIAADTITANEIAADTITAAEIAADTITANEIAANTITAAEIAADTITANELAVDAITVDVLMANDALVDALKATDFSAVNLKSVNISGGTIAIATSSTGLDSESFAGTTAPTGWTLTNDTTPDTTVPGFSVVDTGVPAGSNNGAALKLDHGAAITRSSSLDTWVGSALADNPNAVDVELTTRFQISVPLGPLFTFEMTEFFLRATADPGVTNAWDGLTVRLSGAENNPLTLHTVVNGQADLFANVEGPTLEAGVWQNLKIRIVGGRIEVTLWEDGTTEPEPEIFHSDVNLQPGRVGVRYSDSALLQQTSTGLKVYFDTLNVETFATGFKVTPDGVVDIETATVDDLTVSDADVTDLTADTATVSGTLTAATVAATSLSATTLTGDMARLGRYALTVTDWNEARVNGFFMALDAANAPTTGWLIGYVIAHNDLWVTQIVHSFTTDAPGAPIEFVRDRNNGVWSAWRSSEKFASEVVLAANYTTTTSLVSIGPVVTVNVPSTRNGYLVTATFDAAFASTGGIFVGGLALDGSDRAGQINTLMNAAGERTTTTRSWHVSGLSAGNHTFQLRARSTAGTHTVFNTNTNLVVVQIN